VVKTAKRAKAQILDEPAPAPLAEPENVHQRIHRVMQGMCVPGGPSKAVREEFREMLDKAPGLALIYGDLPHMACNMGLGKFDTLPVVHDSVKVRLIELRKELSGPSPSSLETLLIEAVVLSYQDHFTFALMYGQKTDKSYTLSEMEQWERILSSKESRYLRAVEALARVRRLLKLPAVQVNIGQQVNVSAGAEGG
jgi:hypothetical protein